MRRFSSSNLFFNPWQVWMDWSRAGRRGGGDRSHPPSPSRPCVYELSCDISAQWDNIKLRYFIFVERVRGHCSVKKSQVKNKRKSTTSITPARIWLIQQMKSRNWLIMKVHTPLPEKRKLCKLVGTRRACNVHWKLVLTQKSSRNLVNKNQIRIVITLFR